MKTSNHNISDEEMALLVNILDKMPDDEGPDFFGELKQCAWDILHENPGTEFGDWQSMLIEQYPAELVDALGTNPAEVYSSLADMWESDDFEDLLTGEVHTFMEWSEYFATDKSVELYDKLADAKRESIKYKNIL